MECLVKYPWITAAGTTLLLAAVFGGSMQTWAYINNKPRSWASFLLGLLEAVIYMAAFAGAATIGAAWLALRVASKWKSWDLIKDDEVKRESVVAYGYR